MKRAALALLVACADPPAPVVAKPPPAPVDAGAPEAPHTSTRIRFGAIVVSGKLDRDRVVQPIHEQTAAFEACGAPDLEGRVTVHFQIEKDGAVTTVTADRASDIEDAAVQNCVAKVIQSLKFAAPEDGTPVRVIAPVLFSKHE